MNIGVDIKSLVNNSTGIGKYTINLLDELQRIDIENNYFLFECRETDYAPASPKWKKVSCGQKRINFTIWQQFILPKWLSKYNIDVFWSPDQTCPVLWTPSRTKIVTTVLDFVPLRYPETCQRTDLIRKKLLIGPTVKKSAALVPISEYIAKELVGLFPHARSASKVVRVVGIGVKDQNTAFRPPVKRDNFLFFPGNLEPRKNLSRLVSALEIVNRSGFELDLHVCGPAGWKNSGLRGQIESSPVRERIKFLGYISEDELTDCYLKCMALIYPSIYEGFGMPVIEALKLDTPVLTSKGTVMEEIAGKNAMYFDPYDIESIAAVIIEFLKSGSVAIDRKMLEKYTLKRSAESLLEVFKELRPQS